MIGKIIKYPEILLLSSALFLLGQSPSNGGCEELTPLVDKIAIGVFADLSGESAPNGEDCRRGYEVARLAYGSLAEDRVKLIVGDHKGDAKVGINEFKRAVDLEGASAIVTNRSQIGMTLNPLSMAQHIPLLGVVGHRDFTKGNPYSLRLFPSTTLESKTLAKKAIDMGFRHFAVITLEDEWTESLSEDFIAEATRLGAEIRLHDKVLASESDFLSLISRMKRAEPDAIYLSLSFTQSGLFIRKIREQGLKQQIFSNTWAAKRESIQAAGNYAIEGLLFAEPDLEKPKFMKILTQLFNEKRATMITYACYGALSTAFQTAAKVHDKDEFVRTILSLKSLELLDETIPIVNREASFVMKIKVVRHGEVEML